MIDSCLAWCLLRLFPPSTAIINRRTSPSPWQGLCHPSPLEDAFPFGRRWIGVPLLRMRSLWTESLQREHSGVNRLNVNNSISDISVKKPKKPKNATARPAIVGCQFREFVYDSGVGDNWAKLLSFSSWTKKGYQTKPPHPPFSVFVPTCVLTTTLL